MQVPLGVLLKCETKTVSICESLQSYVPSTEHTVEVSEEEEEEEFTLTADNFHHILFGNNLILSLSNFILITVGGDQLTAARVRGSKRVIGATVKEALSAWRVYSP